MPEKALQVRGEWGSAGLQPRWRASGAGPSWWQLVAWVAGVAGAWNCDAASATPHPKVLFRASARKNLEGSIRRARLTPTYKPRRRQQKQHKYQD